MKRDWHPNQAVYDKGIATGEPDVREDAIVFRWWEEVYIVPTNVAQEIWDARGHFIYAKRSALRKMVKTKKAERWYPKEEQSHG